MTTVRGKMAYVAVIGDMVQSRLLTGSARAAAQVRFTALVAALNRKFRNDIASKFVITIGDEFQGLLCETHTIPELVWAVEDYKPRNIRLGIGLGVLHTRLRPQALNIDGPALHWAREAITRARRERMLGGVFAGFGEHDEVLLGFAQVLRHLRANWTDRQREVVTLLRQGHNQTEAAVRLGISRQAVSERAVSAGWDAYRYAEAGWRRALSLANSRK